MVRHQLLSRSVWAIPGGALEEGETPEEGALRELREEACVDGQILRLLAHGLDEHGEIDTYSFWVDIGDQEPSLGHDPEVGSDPAILVDIAWLSLREIPERDRVFLWRAGLLGVPGFFDEIKTWGNEVSYPGV
jgi:ADP-ribose pyrophosphatase YjhB (NUDIX family)